MSAYADTSFLASLYVWDAHSPLAESQMKQAGMPFLLTPFCLLEFANALGLRLFRKEVLLANVSQAHSMLRHDIDQGIFLWHAVPEAVYEKAEQIARRRTPHLGARTLDILHIASALTLQVGAFYTFDHRQARLARAEGLNVA